MVEFELSCEPQVTNRGSRHIKWWESKLRFQIWQGLIAGKKGITVEMGKHSLCIKDNSQQFYFEHRCELESILWLWPRKKTHHLSDRSWKPEMGVLQFHMSQLQISEVSEKPGPQKVWGDPRGGLGSSLPVHSTLSQPAGEMVMGWFPSADS